MPLITWEYYNSLHDKVSEEAFEVAEALAEKEIREVIGTIRFANITVDTFGYDVLQDCICNVIDRMADDQLVAGRIGLSSVSNDGYTESYNGSTTAEGMHEELKYSIRSWLSGTGLVRAY